MSYLRDPRYSGMWESDGEYNGKYKAADGTLHNSPEEADKHDMTERTYTQAELDAAMQSERETAWLAERVDVQPPTYVTVSDNGSFELTNDPNKAIRFKRMEDARQMAGLFEFEDVRAREHMWCEK